MRHFIKPLQQHQLGFMLIRQGILLSWQYLKPFFVLATLELYWLQLVVEIRQIIWHSIKQLIWLSLQLIDWLMLFSMH